MNFTQDIIDILKEILEPDIEILAFESLKKYGLESISLVRVIVKLEEKYDIEIKEDDLVPENFQTVESICLLLNQYLTEK